MSGDPKYTDEPIVDSGARCRIGEPSQDDIEGHRSKPSMLIGLPSNEGASMHVSLTPSTQPGHRHRRRRKHDSPQPKSDENKPQSTDPSDHVMFLLGEGDGEDGQPHQLFCELDELWHDATGSGETEWREAARWIKFEEDVEENGERWSKPHVATLSLYSLFELRNCLANGLIMLNLEAFTMEQIAVMHFPSLDLTLNVLVSDSRLPAEMRESVNEILLRRHVHLHERLRPKLGARTASNLPIIRSLADIGKRHSSKDVEKEMTSQPSLAKLSNYVGIDTLDPTLAAHVAAHAQAQAQGGHSEVMTGSLQGKFDLHFLKKIPPGSETSNILVGETSFLPAPITVFIRLKESVLLGDLTEVPVPTRFLFIHLGVTGNALKYREIGRSMGVLMSDEVSDICEKKRTVAKVFACTNGTQQAATVPPPPIPEVIDQLSAGGDRLATLCLAAAGQSVLHTQQTPEKNPPDATGASKPDGRSVGSRLELTSIEAGAGGDDAPGSHGDDPALQRTGRLFGGLVADIKRRAPHYLSDFTDALHVQCCASFIFLYFACLTPIITFGGLLAQATGGYLGTIESILSGAVVGILYSLFSGQPLTIMGSTGPVLIFEGIVYRMCLNWNPDLSPPHNCTCARPENLTDSDVLAAMFEQHPLMDVPLITANGSAVMTSGADMDFENFVSMQVDWHSISHGRYSWDSLRYRQLCTFLNGTWGGVGCDPFYVPDVFFFSCILFIFTFFLAIGLKNSRTSSFFPARVRALISDFSVVIAIAATTLTDFLLGLHTPKLLVPTDFEPTLGYKRRGWFIPPFSGNPWWTSLVAFGPALLAVILIFMDQQITAVIVNRRENKLKKGAGYHLDLLLVAVTIMINSIVGIPWFVAATVLSINHVLSLKKESEASAPGERPVYLGCREQRATGVLIFLFIGLSVFMTKLLSRIPMAVLYGIFLFMGISSMRGVQMVQRVSIMFMPIKYQPDYSFLRVSLVPVLFLVLTHDVFYSAMWLCARVHYFTAIQVFVWFMLLGDQHRKNNDLSFSNYGLFVMVLAMCFIRKGLDFIFTQNELKYLDDILPGSKARKSSRSVFRVSSVPDMPNKDGKHIASSNLALEQVPFRSEEKVMRLFSDSLQSLNIFLIPSAFCFVFLRSRLSVQQILRRFLRQPIWRQLSGVDIRESAVEQPKPKPKENTNKRLRRRKTRDETDNTTGQDQLNQVSEIEEKNTNKEDPNKLVLFCIDPKEQAENAEVESQANGSPKLRTPWGTTAGEANQTNSNATRPMLPCPQITVNPPSHQGSPETNRRYPRV
ncbi:Anion exchange protein [Fasciola gigantica]|uniref:Anion exchange protein n=1 Tax=Fasciola gigantica TaxID=46835 RepID=A0A504Y812_FASGI|nr:Anion exchange protein [Fasciola gigantica]